MNKLILLLSALIFTSSAFALKSEPQTLDPALDAELLNQALPGRGVLMTSDRVNILIIGQDNRGPQNVARQKTADGRPALASRADIVMVLSVKKSTKAVSILSYYRGFVPSPTCQARFGLSGADEHLINAAYFYFGRKYFVPCMEQVTEELVSADETLAAEYLDENGKFVIHGILEGTRSNTVKPLADSMIQSMQANWWDMSLIYGNTIFDALGVFLSKDNLAAALEQQSIEDLTTDDVSGDALQVELKERYAYKAGGYQRAFNVAMTISYAIGWGAYGYESSHQSNFGSHYFNEALNTHLSPSEDFATIEQAFLSENDQILRYACFTNDATPLKIVQFGEGKGIYATYQYGKFDFPGKKGKYLGSLKLVPFISPPPDCNPHPLNQ